MLFAGCFTITVEGMETGALYGFSVGNSNAESKAANRPSNKNATTSTGNHLFIFLRVLFCTAGVSVGKVVDGGTEASGLFCRYSPAVMGVLLKPAADEGSARGDHSWGSASQNIPRFFSSSSAKKFLRRISVTSEPDVSSTGDMVCCSCRGAASALKRDAAFPDAGAGLTREENAMDGGSGVMGSFGILCVLNGGNGV